MAFGVELSLPLIISAGQFERGLGALQRGLQNGDLLGPIHRRAQIFDLRLELGEARRRLVAHAIEKRRRHREQRIALFDLGAGRNREARDPLGLVRADVEHLSFDIAQKDIGGSRRTIGDAPNDDGEERQRNEDRETLHAAGA